MAASEYMLHCPMDLEDRMSLLYRIYLLTCVEIAVFGKVMSYSVELFDRVEATVAVKLDAGGEVHHQGGQGGDLF